MQGAVAWQRDFLDHGVQGASERRLHDYARYCDYRGIRNGPLFSSERGACCRFLSVVEVWGISRRNHCSFPAHRHPYWRDNGFFLSAQAIDQKQKGHVTRDNGE
jgi:hypothetical protein